MSELIQDIFLISGAVFMTIASIGIVRLPDFFSRMQAVAKPSTLGMSCLLLAVVMDNFGDWGIFIRVMAIIIFLFLTAPVGAHMIARVAHLMEVPMWKGTVVDELQPPRRKVINKDK